VRAYNPDALTQTPNLDRIAREGMRFTDAHSASSVCSPSRYAILTGRYAWRTRLKEGVLSYFAEPLIEPQRLTLPAMLEHRGYTTAAFGKWHLGLDVPRKGGDGFVRPEQQLQLPDFGERVAGGPMDHGVGYYFGKPGDYVRGFVEDREFVGRPQRKHAAGRRTETPTTARDAWHPDRTGFLVGWPVER
jgi:arylsulfatase A-like enzyme